MSKTNIGDNTGLLHDKSKLSLGALDLFDRVINLKLTIGDGSEYVVRSDYEMYYPDLMPMVSGLKEYKFGDSNKCYIRKCQYKPSIKVQYKRVSMSTPIAVDIYLENFYMFDKNGKMIKNLNGITAPLNRVDIALGYFGQFKEAIQKTTTSAINIDQLFDFNADNLSGHGITFITMNNVEYVQTDKLPPDMMIHIHGYVGNLYTSELKDVATANQYETIKEEAKTIDYGSAHTAWGDTLFEQVCFNCISKNWLSGKKADSYPSSVKALLKDKTGGSLEINGKLSDTDAKLYGVAVYLSDKAIEVVKEYDNEHRYYMDDGEVKEVKIDVALAKDAIGKANAILKAFGIEDLRFTTIGSDILFYVQSEMKTLSEANASNSLKSVYNKASANVYWDNKLPAVYNITTDALCTITCPFFFFLNPFQKFYFKSAYALSGLVSYYANFTASAEDEFYALWQTVSFATVDNINECTIVCTGKKQEA